MNHHHQHRCGNVTTKIRSSSQVELHRTELHCIAFRRTSYFSSYMLQHRININGLLIFCHQHHTNIFKWNTIIISVFFFVWIYFLHCCCYKTYNKWKHFRIHLKSKCVSHLTQTMMMIFNFTFFSQPIKWFHIYLIGFEPL